MGSKKTKTDSVHNYGLNPFFKVQENLKDNSYKQPLFTLANF
ncbi:hypothetical protein G3A_22270 [Bacillus sp. 17376]|nr:hypothetical protein G3A_22270 [Bacillus sp. 17376]